MKLLVAHLIANASCISATILTSTSLTIIFNHGGTLVVHATK